MPRRKATDRPGPVKTRSRDGCQECRSSRVRCDLQKPQCTRCRDRGFPCSTKVVLKWESEFTSRGLAFGRAGIWNKARPYETKTGKGSPLASPSSSEDDSQQWVSLPPVQVWGFINSGVSTFANQEIVDIALNDQRGLVLSTMGLNNSPSPVLSFFPQMKQVGHTELFEFYIQQICPRTTASSKGPSPFASILLPFSVSASPILFKAIQALAACHLSRDNTFYGALALRLKSETLRDLRKRLSTDGTQTCSVDPEILVVIMMLCLYEIADKCDHNWTTHLKGAKGLIRSQRQQSSALLKRDTVSCPVLDFTEHFFAFQDVMGRTACGEEVLFDSDYWLADDQSIDLWMGCSPQLVSILARITEMSREKRLLGSRAAQEAFARQAALLGSRLDNLVQENSSSMDGDDTLSDTAEAKRLAAVLYLHCALFGANPTTPVVVEHVGKILHIVYNLLQRGAPFGVTWPVFVAAVELNPAQDEIWQDSCSGRSVVLQALDMMAGSATSNISRTRAVILQVWQARDQSLLKTPQMPCNDWEWYVAPISTSMSLA